MRAVAIRTAQAGVAFAVALSLLGVPATSASATAPARPPAAKTPIIEGACTTAIQCYIEDPGLKASVRIEFPRKTVSQLRSRTLTVQWERIPKNYNPFVSASELTSVPEGKPQSMTLRYNSKKGVYVGKATGRAFDRNSGEVMVAKITGLPRAGGRKILATVVSPRFGNDGLCEIVLGTLLTSRDTALGTMQALAAAGSVIELTGAPVPPALELAGIGAQLIQVSSIEKTARGDYVLDYVYATTTDALVDEVLDPKLAKPRSVTLTAAEVAEVTNFVRTQGAVNSTTLDKACSLEAPLDADVPPAPTPNDPITNPDVPAFKRAGKVDRRPVRDNALQAEVLTALGFDGLYSAPFKTQVGGVGGESAAIRKVRVYYDSSIGDSKSDDMTAGVDVRWTTRAWSDLESSCTSPAPSSGSVVNRQIDKNTCLTLTVSYGMGDTFKRTGRVRMRVADNMFIDTLVSQWTYPSASAWPMATNTDLVQRAANIATAQRELLIAQGLLPK